MLLSCSHTFHRACLGSWERFSKSRCCPVCRKLHYQKRVIDAALWVNEPVKESVMTIAEDSDGRLPAPSLALSLLCILFAATRVRKSGSAEIH